MKQREALDLLREIARLGSLALPPAAAARSLRLGSILLLAVLLFAHSASALQPQSERAPEREQEHESVTANADDPPRTPEEMLTDFLSGTSGGGLPRGFRYYYVPPAGAAADSGGGAATEGGDYHTAKTAVDPDITFKAYDTAGSDGRSPRQVFDEVATEVVAAGAASGKHGGEGVRELYEGPAADRIIAAAITVLDAHGDNSPKAIKKLIKSGQVSREHAALMWMARDILVRRTLDGLKATLKERHPGMRFEVTILDSGSYGSIGSDIDKTLHLAAWDGDGNEVKTFGPGGQILGGDIAAFLDLAVAQFDALGTELGAANSIAKSMDTEFFSTDTLPQRFARGTTHASGESALGVSAGQRRENFAALQRNPGPAYQFEAKVVAQVVGRTVEQDVALQQERERLAQRRGDLDDLSGSEGRALFLQEMLTSVHSPAVVFADNDPNPRPIDVVEFLERNNLAVRYTSGQAVENALGDYEKLIHKWEAIIRPDGSFDMAAYEGYVNDIAKYGDRAPKDLATTLFEDDGSDKPTGFGQFNRRFGPADARARHELDTDPPNMREYTRDVHDALYGPILERQHGNDEGAQERIQADLSLYWAMNQVNETVLAIKADPSLGPKRPPEVLYAELIAHLETYSPDALRNFERLGTTDPAEAAILAAKQLHLESSVDSAVLLSAGYLETGLDMWLRDPDIEVDRLLASERAKLDQIKLERGRVLARVTAPGSAENEARQRELGDLDRRTESVAKLIRDVEADPSQTRTNIQSAGLEMARRLVVLFRDGGDPNYQRMVGLLGPEYRRDLELMIRVWDAQAAEAEKQDLARSRGIDLARLGNWSADVARRLGHAYASDFGIDTDAYFRAQTGADVGDANAPGRVMGRFFRDNYVNVGAADSALNLIRTMQLARGLPIEQRLAMLSETLTGEMVGPIPGMGPLYMTWKGYQSGDPKALAGGIVNGVQELAQKWIGIAAVDLDNAMIAAGQGSRVGTLNALGGLGGTAALYLGLARTTVEIVGTEAFEPVRDQYFQLAYKGYVDPQQRGLIRAGTTETNNRIPLIPIVEPRGPNWARFVYLKPRLAQRYLEDLQNSGASAAAVALLRLAGLDENLDTGFAASGTCGPAAPAACPVMIDLETDYAALIASAGSSEVALPDMSPALRDRAEQARTRVVEVWQGLAELQRATRARIAADRELRQTQSGELNLWLLAARENLGLALDEQFKRQAQLLYQRLIGLPDIDTILAQEADEAWQQWVALAPSHEDEARIRQQFLQVMSPRIAYEQRVAAIGQQAMDAGAVAWNTPSAMLGEVIDRSVREWMNWQNADDMRRNARVAALERQAAALGAFTSNSYANRAEATPTAPYELSGAADWYGSEVAGWRQFMAEVHTKEPPAGQGLVDLFLSAEDQVARLEQEYALVMQGFGEIDAVVAPKIAQLLLLDWMAGRDPFNDDVQTALKFLWYDADTQGRIRQKVLQDMVRGRRLIPRFRAQATAQRSMLQAALNDIYVEHARLTEDAIRQHFRSSLRMAEAMADARARPNEFEGTLELEVAPYLVADESGVSVIIDTKAHHEIYRALDVVVEAGAKMIPYDAIEAVIGRSRYDEALSAAGIEEDDVLFAVVADAKVTSATPPAGHEDKAYTELPESAGHLFLIPGRPEEVDPLHPADVALRLCALNDSAPDRLWPHETLEYCYPEDDPVLIWDRIAVYFTPARDLSEGYDARKSFVWQILNPNGRVVQRGRYWPTWEEEDTEASLATPLAPDEYPHAFTVMLPIRGQTDAADPGQARLGPGTYTVQTADANETSNGIFGTGRLDVDRSGEWVDEATFQLYDATLHFQGFVTEQVREVPLPEAQGLWGGTWTLEQPQVTPDGKVTLAMNAVWQRAVATSAGEWSPEEEQHRASSTLNLQLPAELDPAADAMGRLGIQLDRHESGRGAGSQTYLFSAGMYLPVPTAQSPPDRYLIESPAPKAFEMSREQFSDGNGRWEFETTSGRGPWFWSQDMPLSLAGDEWATELAGTGTLMNGLVDEEIGLPARRLAGHLHDPDVLWVLPVFVTLSNTTNPEYASFKTTAYAYAIYGAQPGTYDAPLPTGGPAGGPTRTVADASDSGDGNDSDSDASGTGGDEGTDGEGGDPSGDGGNDAGSGDAGGSDGAETDPGDRDAGGSAAIDPTEPDISAFISQWLVLAEPPVNATDGANLRYNHRGTMIGTTRGGIITARHDEGTAFDAVFLWTNMRTLDSVDHCTMEEYVTARVENTSMAYCVGRYVASATTWAPDVAGRRVEEASQLLEGEGFTVVVQIVEEATSEDEALTVLTQNPAPGTEIEPGGEVELGIYGSFTATSLVPDVIGLSAANARARLEGLGMEVEIAIGDEATVAGQAYQVYAQDPPPQSAAAEGSSATLSIYGDYRPRAYVPYLRGSSVEEAREALARAGLTSALYEMGVAPTAAQAYQVAATQPEEGSEVDLGSEVQIRYYSAFVDPRCDDLLRRGSTEADADNTHAARDLLQQARSIGCPATWLDDAISDLDRRIGQWERCETLIKAGNSQRESGDLRATLASYRQASSEGCTNAGLDEAIDDLENTIRQQDRSRQCDSLVDQGNAALNAGDTVGALDAYRQARNAGCTNGGLDQSIADLEREVRQRNDNAQQCNNLFARGNDEVRAGRLRAAIAIYEQAQRLSCPADRPIGQAIAELEDRVDREQREEQRRTDDCPNALAMVDQARRNGDEVQAGILALAATFMGCDASSVMDGIGGSGGGGGGPAIDVRRAGAADFVGDFALTDPERTYEEYHQVISLRADGTFSSTEWLNGRKQGSPGEWSFDPTTTEFDLDWQPGGRMTGPVSGNTNDFIIEGLWSNGGRGRLRVVRR